MTDKTKDGGPAIPRAPFEYTDHRGMNWEVREQRGMTLRDYFAGQALAGLLANARYDLPMASDVSSAFEYADAMLSQREEDQ